MKIVYIIFGTIFVILGLAGVILPLLPTTPFILLAAACYAKGSRTCYNLLLNSKLFGGLIRSYRAGNGIPLKSKIIAVTLLWITIGISASLSIHTILPRIILACIAIGVTTYLYYLPTSNKNNQEDLSVSET